MKPKLQDSHVNVIVNDDNVSVIQSGTYNYRG